MTGIVGLFDDTSAKQEVSGMRLLDKYLSSQAYSKRFFCLEHFKYQKQSPENKALQFNIISFCCFVCEYSHTKGHMKPAKTFPK